MTERPKRRSRALEVLEAQNAPTAPEETDDMTPEEFDLISGLIKRIPGTK